MGFKVYQHLTLTYLSTDVIIDGKSVPVVFEGGSRNNPVRVTAKYGTRNEEIQKQIEARRDFGKEIVLFSEEKETQEPEKPKTPEGFTAISNINTAIAAKNYMLDHFPELKHADMKNTQMIKDVAAERKIIFPEL